MLLTAIVFLLILSVLVLIHEAGHYFVAKKFGIKVEEFGFGFPLTPPLWQKKKGETVYSFYPVLIGGFVKLYGEDEAGGGRVTSQKEVKGDLKRAFFTRPIWQRAAVIVAGVFMNVLLAAFIYYVFLGLSGFRTELPLIGDHKFFGTNQTVISQIIVSEVSKDSPAEKSGVKPFTQVVSINGQEVTDIEAFTKTVKSHAGGPVTLTLQDVKTMKVSTAVVTPRVNPPKGQGALGIAFFPARSVVLSYDTPTQKLLSGFVHPANILDYNFYVIKYFIGISIKEKNIGPVSQGVSGPIGIFSVVNMYLNLPSLKEQVLQLLNLSGMLSISLAFFNVLPIPGLDGGRLLFIVIEFVTRKKVDPKVEGYFHTAGMVVLLALLLLVSIKDVAQFFIK